MDNIFLKKPHKINSLIANNNIFTFLYMLKIALRPSCEVHPSVLGIPVNSQKRLITQLLFFFNSEVNQQKRKNLLGTVKLPEVLEETSTISKRYAEALFELAAERGAVDRVGKDLEQIIKMLSDSSEFKHMINSPIIKKVDQVNTMAELTERIGMDVLSRNFVGLISFNRRLSQLPEMIQAFQLLLAKNRGELFGEVTSSHSLEKNQIEKIKSGLENASGKKFRLKTKVDSSLIGGVLIKVGSSMIDSSIRTKLRNLSNVMKGSG